MEQRIVFQKWSEYINNEIDINDAVVVYSPYTASLLPELDIDRPNFISSHTAFDYLEDSILHSQICPKIVVGLGGGTSIDKAKFIAKKMDLECVAIPSMLSTNVFATDKIAYIDRNNVKSTIEGKLPDIIVYDTDLIGSSNTRFSIYGLADALSTLTALRDWEIADSKQVEKIKLDIYLESTMMLIYAKRIIKSGDFNTLDIFHVLMRAGAVTNDYGSGRPESGSEHIIAKGVEHQINVPHAVAVCFGMLITSQFQGCFEEVVDLIKGLGIFEEIMRIPYEVLKATLVTLQPRPDRYTVIDTLSPEDLTPTKVEMYLRRMYKAFGINEGAVIFDLDGVLWDSMAEIQFLYQKFLNLPDPEVLRDLMGKSAKGMAEALNISLSELSEIQQKEIAYLMENPGKIYKGVPETLWNLKLQERELFIVSNCQKGYINTFLENYHLSEYFTEWRYDDRTSAIPKLANLQDLKEKYHLFRPVYIGDTNSDCTNARAAGIDFIAADYGFGTIPKEVRVRIDDIIELVDLLEKRL